MASVAGQVGLHPRLLHIHRLAGVDDTLASISYGGETRLYIRRDSIWVMLRTGPESHNNNNNNNNNKYSLKSGAGVVPGLLFLVGLPPDARRGE